MKPYDALLIVAEAIRGALTPDLLREPYRSRAPSSSPVAGHCYAASEALYHLFGGKAGPFRPAFVRVRGEPHWYLESKACSTIVVDLTSDQFAPFGVPYEEGVGKGFLTREPSKRAREVMRRVLRDAKVARALGKRKGEVGRC